MSAPERIWVQWPHVNGAGLAFTRNARPPALRHEYIRADLIPAAALAVPEVAEAEQRVARIAASLFPGGYDANLERINAALRGEGRNG